MQSVGGGGTQIPPYGIIGGKIRLLIANSTLDCTAIAKPDLVNPAIVAGTSRDLLTFQEEQRGL